MNAGTKLTLPVLLFLSAASIAQPIEPTPIYSAPSPSRPVVLTDGLFLVGYRTLGANDAGVLIVDDRGDISGLIGGLPYVGARFYQPGDLNGDRRIDAIDIFFLIDRLFAGGPPVLPTPLEPDGMALRGSSLFIGTGEIAPAGRQASPDRGAVLRVTFSAGIGFHGFFFLPAESYPDLLAGRAVVLTNTTGTTATVSLLVNGFPAVSDLTVDENTARLYITSRADGSISWIPLPR